MDVPVPILERRWVHVTVAFVVGFLAMMLLVWIMNGIRSSRAEQVTSDAEAKKRTASLAWQTEAEAAFGTVGTPNEGLPPTVMPQLTAGLEALRGDAVDEGTAEALDSAAEVAGAAADRLEVFDMVTAVADQGFTPLEATAFTSSQTQLVAGLRLYQRAAQVAAEAVRSEDPAQRTRLTKLARGLRDQADTIFIAGWQQYQSALRAGGLLAELPPGPIPGLPGGGG